MQTVAQSWLVYRMTGSSALLGLVGFSSQIPVFLFSPFGGVAADRHNRHRMIVVTQSLSMALALILAALTLTGTVRIWHLFVLSAALGVVNAVDIPAAPAFFQEMVGRDDLINAIALNSSMFNSARIVGPAIAGMLVAWIGEGWCFFVNGVSYIAVIAGLLMMHVTPRVIDNSKDSAWQHVLEGARFVISARPIRTLLLLVALVSFFGLQYSVLMPIFADKIFHSGAHGLGVLLGINGAGALLRGTPDGCQARTTRTQSLDRGSGFGVQRRNHGVRICAHLLDRRDATLRGRIRHHGPVRFDQHFDPDDDAGSPPRARHLGLFDDVHGHDADRVDGGRPRCGAYRRAPHHLRRRSVLPDRSLNLCVTTFRYTIRGEANGAERVDGDAAADCR